jgi:hypothetical protein
LWGDYLKAICITDGEPRLTKGKKYQVYHTYFNEYEVVNDLGHLKYYSKDYFYIMEERVWK